MTDDEPESAAPLGYVEREVRILVELSLSFEKPARVSSGVDGCMP